MSWMLASTGTPEEQGLFEMERDCFSTLLATTLQTSQELDRYGGFLSGVLRGGAMTDLLIFCFFQKQLLRVRRRLGPPAVLTRRGRSLGAETRTGGGVHPRLRFHPHPAQSSRGATSAGWLPRTFQVQSCFVSRVSGPYTLYTAPAPTFFSYTDPPPDPCALREGQEDESVGG